MTGLNAYEGSSVIARHDQEERRRDALDAAEARDRLALEDYGPIPPKTSAHIETVKRIQEDAE